MADKPITFADAGEAAELTDASVVGSSSPSEVLPHA
jgi:hypothetical protein